VHFPLQALVVQKEESAIHQINYHPVESEIHLLNNWGQMTLYKTDISLRRTLGASPKGVRLRES